MKNKVNRVLAVALILIICSTIILAFYVYIQKENIADLEHEMKVQFEKNEIGKTNTKISNATDTKKEYDKIREEYSLLQKNYDNLKEDYEQELVNRDEWHKLYVQSLDPLEGEQMYTSYRTDVTFDMLKNGLDIQYMEKIKLRGTYVGIVMLQDNIPAYLVYIDGNENQPMVVSYFDSMDTSVVLDTIYPLQDDVKFTGFFYGTAEYILDGEHCTALHCGFTEFDHN